MASPTLGQLLSDSARRWPGRVAVGTAAGDRKATYRDLRALTRDLAAKLHGLGISRTDTVAIFSDNSMEFVLALFGVLFLGAAAAPLNPDLGRRGWQGQDWIRRVSLNARMRHAGTGRAHQR
jgi:acyl-CoA synthetase (AMP-forming)/AMP-acid ligase II